MLLRIETREDGHVGGERRRVLDDSTFEQSTPGGEGVQEGAGVSPIAIGPEVIGPQRVDRDQNVAPSRLRIETAG